MKLCDLSEHDLAMGGYLKADEEHGCIMCGAPTPFIEICSEAYFCSTECVDNFFDLMIIGGE